MMTILPEAWVYKVNCSLEETASEPEGEIWGVVQADLAYLGHNEVSKKIKLMWKRGTKPIETGLDTELRVQKCDKAPVPKRPEFNKQPYGSL